MSIGTSGSPPATELNPEGIADRTTVGVFFGQAARYGERPLVHHLAGEKWKTETWADMKRYVLAVASALVDAGVKQGDRVVLLGENRYEWLVSDFAIQAAGGGQARRPLHHRLHLRHHRRPQGRRACASLRGRHQPRCAEGVSAQRL